jgi:HlyD family secretion protein
LIQSHNHPTLANSEAHYKDGLCLEVRPVKSETSQAAEAKRLTASLSYQVEPRDGVEARPPEILPVETIADHEAPRSDRTGYGTREHLNRSLEQSAVAVPGSTTNTPGRTADRIANDAKPGSTQKKFFSSAKVIAIVAVVLLAIGGGSFYGYQEYQKSQNAKKELTASPAVVTVTKAVSQKRTVEDELSVTGSVWAWDPLAIGSEVSGLRIMTVNVEEGDRVKKGQVLATLNSALLRAQLEQAKARLQSSHANLGKAIQPNRPEDIIALKAALAQAEANVAQEVAKRHQADASLGNAEVTAHRFSELAKAGAISTQDAENRQVTAVNALEDVKSADERINAAKSLVAQAHQKLLVATRGGRLEDVQISRATILEIKAQIQHLEQQIAQTIIRAPDDGLISRRDAHIGDISAAGTPMFLMVRMDRLELRAQVSDIDIAKIQPGQPVEVTLKEEDSKPIIGKVRLVNPLVDPATRYGVVRIDLPDDEGLKQGMFVRGEIKVGLRDAVTVPIESLVTRNGESVVFKLDSENRALSTVVKPGVQTETFAEITEGLAAGETIVGKGARFLADRDIVRVGK